MLPRRGREIDLGSLAPLTLGRPAPDLGRVSFRWTAGIVLMGVAGLGLFGCVVRAALGHRANFAVAPVVAAVRPGRQAVAEGSRGDRLARVRSKAAGTAAVRIEQLSGSGAMRNFTQVSARLAELDLDALASAGQESAVDGSDGKPAQTSGLPPIILYGAKRGPSAPSVTAYAEDGPLATPFRAIGTPVNVTAIPRSPAAIDTRRQVVAARTGDTPGAILDALAVASGDEREKLAGALDSHGQGTFAGGETITILEDLAHRQIRTVTIEHADRTATTLARSDAGAFVPVVREQPAADTNGAQEGASLDTRMSSGESLRDGLYGLARSNHVDEAVVAEVMRLCGHDFDLDGPLGAEDTVDILFAPDEFGQPELVFVDLTVQRQHRRYYRFTAPDDGSTSFYDETGRAITKFLLRKPVVSGRLGDGFGWRIHPVLRDRRFHEGVDYAAPYGSPIAAAGSGVVEVIGQQWGYGKYIRVMHDRGYETTYAHVAGFPSGLKIGDRVRQGETIAFVGSTGLSTGPHLYYELRINGHNVDPLTVKLADGRVLQGGVQATFDRQRNDIDRLLAASTLTRSHLHDTSPGVP